MVVGNLSLSYSPHVSVNKNSSRYCPILFPMLGMDVQKKGSFELWKSINRRDKWVDWILYHVIVIFLQINLVPSHVSILMKQSSKLWWRIDDGKWWGDFYPCGSVEYARLGTGPYLWDAISHGKRHNNDLYRHHSFWCSKCGWSGCVPMIYWINKCLMEPVAF